MTQEEKKEAELQALDDEVYSEVLGLRLTPWGPMKFTPALLFMPAMSARTCRSYSTDIAAAWEMEEEVQRQGLHFAYGLILSTMVCAVMPDNIHSYHLAHAAPEMRCRAALMTVREALAASCLAEAGRCKPLSEATP